MIKGIINDLPQIRSGILPFLILFLILSSCTNRGIRSRQIPEPVTVLELPPSENNPRNSEGDFISLATGRILFIYTRYSGDSSSDHAPACLASRYSDDGGKTWSTEDRMIAANEGGMNIMSVSLLRLQNGDIALFYLRKNSTTDCIPMMRVSRDEAESWSDATPCITGVEGYFVLNNDRVIQLKDGRLMMPVALHNTPGGKWSSRGSLFCYYSDDHGKSWTPGNEVPNNSGIITQEPGLIEMNDGRVMMYIRAGGGFQQRSFSSDRGQTWSPVEVSNIPSPLSPATIEKIPGTGDWLLVWNNNDGSVPEIKDKRTPLTIAVSGDEGKSWKHVKNIRENPEGWYCYIAVHFPDNKHLLLGYCAGDPVRGKGLTVTDVSLVSRSWLYK